MDEIIGEFLVESYEGLDRLDQNLVILEETPDDKETLTEVFRILHTIKGTCGFLAFSNLETVAHRGENLLSLLRDHVLELDSEITDALLATVDAIRRILARIEETEEDTGVDESAVVALLERLAERSETGGGQTASAPAAEAPETAESVEAASDTTEAVEAAEDIAEPVEASGTSEPVEAATETAEPVEATEDTPPVTSQDEGTPASAESPAPERIGDVLVDDGSAERTDVEIAAVEQDLGDDRKLGEILVDQGKAAQADVNTAARKQSSASATIRVDVAVLDSLMNLVGELVLARNQISQLAGDRNGKDFAAPAQRLNLITSELQESVMRTRMQPIGNIWNKLPRVVRDLAHQFDKQVRLEMTGKDTELDRTIIEAIKDPLTHMVRNTIDHGIESPEERAAAGKPEEGLLRLSATHEGGLVNIEISDDGKGIDPDAMIRKAVDKGVITAEASTKMSDTEAVQLIFSPGFSTAEKVTNVSGRGVGMDVVRTNVEKIGGSVEVITKKGFGTTFKVKIPLTLAIVPAITVICDNTRYAIPQMSLQGLVRIENSGDSGRIEDVHGAPVYRFRGRLLPIVDLRRQLGLAESEETDVVNLVVLNADGRLFGLVVDEIADTEEIVVKPLGRAVKGIDRFSGATVMGDGRVALILDVLGLASGAKILGSDSRAMADEEPEEEKAIEVADDEATYLVVDLGNSETWAVALSDVERLEEFEFGNIEYSDHRSVVQYNGDIMTLVDLGENVGGQSVLNSDGNLLQVVVCEVGGVTVGLAVHEILDIALRPTVHRGATGRPETAIIDGRVTDIVNVGRVVAPYIPFDINSEMGVHA